MVVYEPTLAGSPSRTLEMMKYQKLAFWSAFLGYVFDCMDLNIFTLILVPSMRELLQTADRDLVQQAGSVVIAVKLICWGVGGVLFGIVADRFGRARTLVITILIYAVFTGLSGLARRWVELIGLQGIAAFGIGGEWAVGAALVAEAVPDQKRDGAMGFIQSSFAIGFLMAAVVNWILGPYSWRWVLAFGSLPALWVLSLRRRVPESERWLSVRTQKQGSMREVFEPRLQRSTIVGIIIAAAMMIGSWGGITLLPNWIRELLGKNGDPVKITSLAFMLMMGAGIPGYAAVVWGGKIMGRRPLYFLCSLGGLLASLYMFLAIKNLDELLWFAPVYGFFVMGGFAIFGLYLPELFPTRVRATGQGICYNVSRAMTAIGPLAVAYFGLATFGSLPHAAATTAIAYVVGLIAIWFGPETWRKPLAD
jgi:MFS family permease